MRAVLRGWIVGLAIIGIAVSAAACGTGSGPVTVPASIGPDRTVSPVVVGTRADIARVLGERPGWSRKGEVGSHARSSLKARPAHILRAAPCPA